MVLPVTLGRRLPYDQGASAFLLRSKFYGGGWVNADPRWVSALNSDSEIGAYVPVGPAAIPLVWDFSRQTGAGVAIQTTDEYFGYSVVFAAPVTVKGAFLTVSQAARRNGGYSDWSWFSTNSILRAYLQTSPDTSNGVDGSWAELEQIQSLPAGFEVFEGRTALTDWLTTGRAVAPSGNEVTDYSTERTQGYRVEGPSAAHARAVWATDSPTGICSIGPYQHIRGIRCMFPAVRIPSGNPEYTTGGFGLRLHLYGELEGSSATQRVLRLWDPNLDRELPPSGLSWGDVSRSSTSDLSFRIRNPSMTEVAREIQVSVPEDRWTSYPSPSSQLLFSLDGLSWAPSVELGALGPGSTSPLIRLRRITPSNALLGSAVAPVSVAVGGWS